MMRYEVTHETYRQHRDVLHQWVLDHGLVLDVVPVPTTFYVGDGVVEVEVFVLNEQGKKYVVGDGPARRRVSVPLRRPWPLPVVAS